MRNNPRARALPRRCATPTFGPLDRNRNCDRASRRRDSGRNLRALSAVVEVIVIAMQKVQVAGLLAAVRVEI